MWTRTESAPAFAECDRTGADRAADGGVASAPFQGLQDRHGGSTMASGKSDELKGRVKEAAGTLTGDQKLKREGKTDQTVGKIKQKVDNVIDKVRHALD